MLSGAIMPPPPVLLGLSTLACEESHIYIRWRFAVPVLPTSTLEGSEIISTLEVHEVNRTHVAAMQV